MEETLRSIVIHQRFILAAALATGVFGWQPAPDYSLVIKQLDLVHRDAYDAIINAEGPLAPEEAKARNNLDRYVQDRFGPGIQITLPRPQTVADHSPYYSRRPSPPPLAEVIPILLNEVPVRRYLVRVVDHECIRDHISDWVEKTTKGGEKLVSLRYAEGWILEVGDPPLQRTFRECPVSSVTRTSTVSMARFSAEIWHDVRNNDALWNIIRYETADTAVAKVSELQRQGQRSISVAGVQIPRAGVKLVIPLLFLGVLLSLFLILLLAWRLVDGDQDGEVHVAKRYPWTPLLHGWLGWVAAIFLVGAASLGPTWLVWWGPTLPAPNELTTLQWILGFGIALASASTMLMLHRLRRAVWDCRD